MSHNIAITHIPLSTPWSEVKELAVEDRFLIGAMALYKQEYEKDGIEVFEWFANCIATEKGYYMAVYEKDLFKTNQ